MVIKDKKGSSYVPVCTFMLIILMTFAVILVYSSSITVVRLQKTNTETVLIDNGYHASWKEDILVIIIELCNKTLPLFCRLGTHFPYEFPTIYLSNAALNQLPSIPHKYRDKSLCLFDSSAAVPNINHPCEVILDCVRKAEAILKEGMEETNQQDFIDEFLAYWGSKHDNQVQMFVDGLDVCKQIILLGDGKDGIIVDANDDDQDHLAEFALKNKPDKKIHGLLIPLDIGDITLIPHDDFSESASLFTNDVRGPVLRFSFQNKSENLECGAQTYEGYNMLTLEDDQLNGFYMNNRTNPNQSGGNIGTINLHKEQKNKLRDQSRSSQ